jgi:hypothetical protein
LSQYGIYEKRLCLRAPHAPALELRSEFKLFRILPFQEIADRVGGDRELLHALAMSAALGVADTPFYFWWPSFARRPEAVGMNGQRRVFERVPENA